jgi:DNA modification methylase
VNTVRIINADVMAGLATLPDESVNCCVTSPPYWGLRDYGVDGQIGLEESPDTFVARLVEVFREVRRVLRSDGTCWVNLGDSYASGGKGGGGSFMKERGDAAWQSRSDVNGWRSPPPGLKHKDLVGIPWMTAFALRADGWYLRQEIIWEKPNPMPESVTDRCTKAHEQLFLFTKAPRYAYDAGAIKERAVCGARGSEFHTGKTGEHQLGRASKKPRGKWSTQDKQSSGRRITERVAAARAAGASHDNPFGEYRNKRSVWTITTKPYAGAHFATFPEELPANCIKAGCPEGGAVLDPFGGAGTTGLVAAKLGRDAILCELNPEYAVLARNRIEDELPLMATVQLENRADRPSEGCEK